MLNSRFGKQIQDVGCLVYSIRLPYSSNRRFLLFLFCTSECLTLSKRWSRDVLVETDTIKFKILTTKWK